MRCRAFSIAVGIAVHLTTVAAAHAQTSPVQAPYPSPPASYPPPPSWAPAGPKQLAYKEGDPIPAGYHPEKRARKGLVVGGACMFGAAYLGSLLGYAFASDNGDHEYWPLVVPVLGPFLTMATANVPLVKGDGAPGVLLLIDGVLQGGGVALAVLGITEKKTVLLRNDIGVRVWPLVGPGAYGLSASIAL